MNKFFNGSLNPNEVNAAIDKFIDNSIKDAIAASTATYRYTVKDLDKKVNEDETLREYIEDSCETFKVPLPDLDNMDADHLNDLIHNLDDCWNASLRV